MRGIGSTTTEDVYVWINTEFDVGDNAYAWRMQMTEVYDPDFPVDNQIGVSPFVYHLMGGSLITYWFYISDRRLIVVTKIGTQYTSSHVGMFLPFALPSEYPYPLYLGGSSSRLSDLANPITNDRSFFDPGLFGAWVDQPNGQWKRIYNHLGTTTTEDDPINYRSNIGNIWPWGSNVVGLFEPQDLDRWDVRPLPGQTNAGLLIPAHLMLSDWLDPILGMLEDVFWLPGVGIVSEQSFTSGMPSLTYRVFQNYNRTGRNHFCAIVER